MKQLKKYFPYLAGLGISLIFGLSFTFTAKGLEYFSPMTLIANRFFLAAVFCALLALLKITKTSYKNKPIKNLIYLSAAEPIFYFIFETYGIQMTNASLSGMMIALIPIVVLILGTLFLRERPSAMQWFFVFLSVIGAILIVMGSHSSSAQGAIRLSGFIMLWGAVICAASFNVLSKYSSADFSPVEITFFMMWLGAVFFGSISVVANKGFSGYALMFSNYDAFFTVLYLGVVSSVIAFFLNNYMISRLSVPAAAVFANLVSVVSVLAGIFIRGERLSPVQIIGALVILTGIFGVNIIAEKIKAKA